MCLPSSSDESAISQAFSDTDRVVPTFPIETTQQQLNVTDLSCSDLAQLQKNDPFMYYSIPSVKNAALHCKDVYAPFLRPSSSQQSCSETKSKDNALEKCIVTRQRRLSTECHPDLILEAMFSGGDFAENSESGDDDHDDLYDFLLGLYESAR